MRSTLRTALAALVVGGLSLGSALAAEERERAAHGIVERWAAAAEARGYPVDGWRRELLSNLMALDGDRLGKASQAASYGELIQLVTGTNPDGALRTADTDTPPGTPMALGDKAGDLMFFAINPCRLMDTRLGTGVFAGPRAPGSTTTITTRLTSGIVAQGGNPAGCPLPDNDAGALAYTITLVDYSGNAFATVFPATAVRPNASTINIGPGTAPTPLANSSIVQQCVGCGDFTDVSIYLEGASANVIIDAIGYFDETPTVICQAGTGGGTFDLDGTCQNVASCTIINPPARIRSVICQAVITTFLNHAQGLNDEIIATIATTSNTCSVFEGAAHLGIPSALPSSSPWRDTLSPQGFFTMFAGSSQTFFLNAMQVTGNDPSDLLERAHMVCRLYP